MHEYLSAQMVFDRSLGALLAGCTVGPDYHRPPVPVPAQYKELPGWTAAAPADAAPKGDWWTDFHDPLLDQLEPMVAVSNQTVRQNYDELPASAGRGARSRAPNCFRLSASRDSATRSGGPGYIGYRRRRAPPAHGVSGRRVAPRARRVGRSTSGGRCAA